MEQQDCNYLYQIIGTSTLSVLLILSELLPFIKSIKSNGLIDAIQNILKK